MEVFSVDLNAISGDELLAGVGVVGRVCAVLSQANALWHNPPKVCIEVKVLAEVCRPWFDNQIAGRSKG